MVIATLIFYKDATQDCNLARLRLFVPQTQKNDKFRQKFVVFQLYSPCGELYAQTRDICFTSDMSFALLRLQGEYNITVSIIREANWRTISLRAQRVISRRAKRGISPKNARVQVHTKNHKNIFFVRPSQNKKVANRCPFIFPLAWGREV